VSLAAATPVAAAAVAGTLYATSHRAGTHTPAAQPRQRATTAPPRPSTVPAGYHLVHDDRLGVSFPVPDGWKTGKPTDGETTYKDETGLAGITIGTVAPAGNPKAHFTDIETNTKVNYPTYRRLRMQQTTFRGQPAAVWEFTFKGRVRVFRAIDLGYGREGAREYDIYLAAPETKWDTFRPVFDNVVDGFTTTGS
jgi:eukaryotic-like serine/threonine-protein kinase